MSGLATNGLDLTTTFPIVGTWQFAVDTQNAAGLNPETVALNVNQVIGYVRAPVALTDGVTIAVDASLSNVFTVTLGGNRTLSNPTNLQAGQAFQVIVTQDGTGNRTLAFGTAYKFSGSSTLTTTIGAIDMLSFRAQNGTTILGTLAAKFA